MPQLKNGRMEIFMNTKKTALWGMLTALAFVLSYLETLIPFSIGIPGAKLGLANLVVLTALYKLGYKDAFILNLIRIFLTAMTFGNVFSLIMSLAGGMLSYVVMALAKKTEKLPVILVSISGGISHNIGQILAAVFVIKNIHVLAYLPVLLFIGIISGTLIGIAGKEILEKLQKL